MTNSSNIYYPINEVEKSILKSIWRVQEFNNNIQTETILPKGTVELIFNLSDKITYLNPTTNVTTNLPCCFINGINFKPLQLIKSGQQIFLGIQLNALGIKALFDIPATELNNTVVESSQVCKSLADLYHQLFAKSLFDSQVEIIKKWLYHKISTSKHFVEIQKLYGWFYSQNINILSVKEFCNNTCISDRQLRRLSSEWVGMSTEKFLLYNKYLSSLYLLHNSDLTLTQIGMEAGFYDQSHFIRDFKLYTGMKPKEYKSANSSVLGHIFR
ncbi:MAG: helix-turn-helix transcriptional regulator [Bacteroidia bacterium]|nr:helix-turn-helix transcriptional regulator [Bacteroidia bacterium]